MGKQPESVPSSMTPQDFVRKWRTVSANEKKACQQYFIELCRFVDRPTSLEEDPSGKTHTVMAGASQSPHVRHQSQAAKELVERRDAWPNRPGLSEVELKKRTLTNLYNQRPTWLAWRTRSWMRPYLPPVNGWRI